MSKNLQNDCKIKDDMINKLQFDNKNLKQEIELID